MANILLLEPNRLLASQYRRYLEQQDHVVTWCQNAQNGINIADSMTPDIVIMELLLAGHSGIEFLYEFRSYSEWQNIPVIVLSRLPRTGVTSSDRVFLELGVLSYLYKPETSLHSLGQKLESILTSLQPKTSKS
jgi:DNA-binding response OmpR family regulator